MDGFSSKPLFRPTWATIDLKALARNCENIARHLMKGRAKVMGMVKADAYGHGAVPVSLTLERSGACALGVATVEEGVELREAGIRLPILVMGGLMGAGSPASGRMVEADLTPVIHSAGVLASLEADAARFGRRISIHLKIDTGMSRLGVRPESLRHLLDVLRACPHLELEGVMTHLAEADSAEVSRSQMHCFLECRREVETKMGRVRVWHIANSRALLGGEPLEVPGAAECWARPGLALYGEAAGGPEPEGGLSPVMGLVSQAVLLKRIPAGSRVSYGGTFVTRRPTRIAIVPIGYADGYPWSVSGKASVLVRGRRAPVIGRVTMDMIIVDVTEVEGVEVNDEAVLLGSQGEERISLSELAGWAGTIPYEILCGISKRMPRILRN